MINTANNKISLSKQCCLLGINRTSLYYKPTIFVDKIDNKIIDTIVKIYELCPFYGVRRVYQELKRRGLYIGRDSVGRIKKELKLRTFYPEPRTTFRNKSHKVYPYLLNDIKIGKSNQVWASDITYIPLKQGFAYLVSIIDLYSRKILSWELSNSLDKSFCIESMKEAIERYEKPEIFNSDQGSQFTSNEFCRVLLEEGINISMDSKGRAIDNIYIERFWRTLKYEDIYLNRYETMLEAKIGINKFIQFYNSQRVHSSLEYKTPDEIYYNTITKGENTNEKLILTKKETTS